MALSSRSLARRRLWTSSFLSFSFPVRTLFGDLDYIPSPPSVPFRVQSLFGHQTKSYCSFSGTTSPFISNLIRIINTVIDNQMDYAHPSEPVTKFNSFIIEDQPGKQFIRLTRRYGDNESIKIDATMFNGCVSLPKPGSDTDGQDLRFHLSMIVEISKSRAEKLLLTCSTWPDCLEIQGVLLPQQNLFHIPYLGPNFRNLNDKLKKILHQFLKERRVYDKLCRFLHGYMLNKDRNELLKWLGKVKSYMAN